MVAHNFNRKAESMSSLEFISNVERPFAMDDHALANRFARLGISEPTKVLAYNVALSSLWESIKACQFDDPRLLELKDTVKRGSAKKVVIEDDGVM